MKKKQIIVGIDVSKSTLDVFIRGINYSFVVENGPKGFSTLLETICNEAKCNHRQLFICFENTGRYSKMLSVFLHSLKIVFCMETALAIKKSLGITRGKNDRIDAQRIADYAFYFIAYTANFTLFATARAYACYCGIAPFENSSGTVKGRAKVHHYTNKQLKSLLNMASSSVIQTKGEYRDYYNKRVKELGKRKISTLNIFRNKLGYRVFAVANRQTPYVDLYKFAA